MFLIIAACTVNNPGLCKDFKIQLSMDVPATKCAQFSMHTLAAWAGDHPNWVIKSWKCSGLIEEKI